MTKYSKTELKSKAKTIRANIKQGKGLPTSITLKDTDGKIHNLKKTEYLGLYHQQNIFITRHGRYPNWVTQNTTYGRLPVAQNYQDNAYTCCPTSFSMATMCLFDYHSESECARVLGTVYGSGTDPSNLVANAKKLGYTATPIPRNYQAVLKSLQKGKPVICHYETGGNTKPSCMGFRNNYGHYCLIYWCKKGNYYIADPTKGQAICKATAMDKATNGRNIKYYSIGIL